MVDLHVACDADVAAVMENEKMMTDLATGLKHARDIDGNLWPWAFRHPTKKESGEMGIKQLLDVCHREETDWKPQTTHADTENWHKPAS